MIVFVVFRCNLAAILPHDGLKVNHVMGMVDVPVHQVYFEEAVTLMVSAFEVFFANFKGIPVQKRIHVSFADQLFLSIEYEGVKALAFAGQLELQCQVLQVIQNISAPDVIRNEVALDA